jgi:hypothetical protein
MQLVPNELIGWIRFLMHTAEVFVLGITVAFVSGLSFRIVVPFNIGNALPILHCVVTLFLLVLSLIMKIKKEPAASTGFAVTLLGIIVALYLLPTLTMAR